MSTLTEFNRDKIVFCTNKGISKELLAENLEYLCMVCSLALKNLRKLGKWRTKKWVTGLKHYLEQMNTVWKSCP